MHSSQRLSTPLIEMSELPRQADIQAAMETSNRIPVNVPQFMNEDWDIYSTLAFMNYVQSAERNYTMDRITPHDASHEPLNSPTRQPWRLSKFLDSLASICMSSPQKEIVATAIRYDHGKKSVEVLLSTNSTVPKATIDHVIRVWHILKEVSAHMYRIHPEYSTLKHSPPGGVSDPQMIDLTRQLEISVIKFTFRKFRDV